MKYTLSILFLCVGFASGWYFSNQRMEEKVKEAFPPEMQAMVDELIEIVGPMRKEDVQETLDLIQNFSEHAVKEFDQMDMWRASTSNQILLIEEEEGLQKAKEHAYYLIDNFRENYEDGISVGEWQELADKVYESTNRLKSDPDGGINSVTSLRDSTP